jgi:hypothetical protein
VIIELRPGGRLVTPGGWGAAREAKAKRNYQERLGWKNTDGRTDIMPDLSRRHLRNRDGRGGPILLPWVEEAIFVIKNVVEKIVYFVFDQLSLARRSV